MNYESTRKVQSGQCPGVAFTIYRISLGRRLELARRIREATAKVEFLKAGSDPREELEAGLLEGEADRICLLWGLAGIEGLEVDDKPATAEALIEAGPERLCREILAAIRAELGLSEEERKN